MTSMHSTAGATGGVRGRVPATRVLEGAFAALVGASRIRRSNKMIGVTNPTR